MRREATPQPAPVDPPQADQAEQLVQDLVRLVELGLVELRSDDDGDVRVRLAEPDS